MLWYLVTVVADLLLSMLLLLLLYTVVDFVFVATCGGYKNGLVNETENVAFVQVI